MKQEISPKTMIATVAAIVIVLAIGAAMYYRSDAASGGPPLKPKAWKPPAAWSGAGKAAESPTAH